VTTKKNLIIVVLATFCLATSMFAIRSYAGWPYDPWWDVNDDGKIDVQDLARVSGAFGTYGTEINKTQLLLDLQAKIDSLNDTLTARLDVLEGRLNDLDTLLNDAQLRISTLENRTITWNSTYVNSAATTETLSWQDVSGLSVDINVNQTCYLLVMFSTMAYSYIDQFTSGQIWIHAKVDSTTISPDWLYVNSKVEVTGWAFLDAHYHRSYYGTYSYDFKPQLVTAGSHTVKIQWRTDDGTAILMGSTLTVIAVPIP